MVEEHISILAVHFPMDSSLAQADAAPTTMVEEHINSLTDAALSQLEEPINQQADTDVVPTIMVEDHINTLAVHSSMHTSLVQADGAPTSTVEQHINTLPMHPPMHIPLAQGDEPVPGFFPSDPYESDRSEHESSDYRDHETKHDELNHETDQDEGECETNLDAGECETKHSDCNAKPDKADAVPTIMVEEHINTLTDVVPTLVVEKHLNTLADAAHIHINTLVDTARREPISTLADVVPTLLVEAHITTLADAAHLHIDTLSNAAHMHINTLADAGHRELVSTLADAVPTLVVEEHTTSQAVLPTGRLQDNTQTWTRSVQPKSRRCRHRTKSGTMARPGDMVVLTQACPIPELRGTLGQSSLVEPTPRSAYADAAHPAE